MASQRCRVHDTPCINPAFCDERDACCAGDPACVPPPPGYRVICISLYDEDLAALDRAVAEIKARGFRRANRSWLIRVAAAKLDLDAITLEDRSR